MTKYVELRKELKNPSKRNFVVPIGDLPKNVEPKKDCYRSLFFYDEDIKDHVKKTGSVSQYRGPVGADKLVWDFDSADDVEQARKAAVELCRILVEDYNVKLNEIGVFFSGKKGFGVELKTEGLNSIENVLDPNIPFIVKRVCLKIAKNIPTLDIGLYSLIRLYRIPNTKHNGESIVNGVPHRLFKIQISVDTLVNSSVQEIQTLAKNQPTKPVSYDFVSQPEQLNKLIEQEKKNVENSIQEAPLVEIDYSATELDDSKCPPEQKTCIWRLNHGVYTEARDNTLLIIATHDKNQGMPKPVVRAKLQGVLDLMNQKDPKKALQDPILDSDLDRIVNQAFSHNYSFNCSNLIMDANCSKKCYLAPKKFSTSEVGAITFLEAYKQSIPFFSNFSEKRITLGYKIIDSKTPLFLGTFNLIVGQEGSGKTTLMMNIINHLVKKKTNVLFFNADMGEQMMVQKFAPILIPELGMSGLDFMAEHENNNSELIKKATEAFASLSTHFQVSSHTKLTISQIEREIDRQEQLTGQKTKVVIIDYVQLLFSPDAKDGYARYTMLAQDLNTLAKKKEVCILGISQTGRDFKRADNKADILAKGSGAWEEQITCQINCYRPFQRTNPDFDFVMTLNVYKNRMGPLNSIDLDFNGKTGVIQELTPEKEALVIGLKAEANQENN